MGIERLKLSGRASFRIFIPMAPFERASFVDATVNRGRFHRNEPLVSLREGIRYTMNSAGVNIVANLYVYLIVTNAVRPGVVSRLIKAETSPCVSCA